MGNAMEDPFASCCLARKGALRMALALVTGVSGSLFSNQGVGDKCAHFQELLKAGSEDSITTQSTKTQ